MLNNAGQRCEQKQHLGRKMKKQTISGCNRLCVVLSAKEQVIYISLAKFARVTRSRYACLAHIIDIPDVTRSHPNILRFWTGNRAKKMFNLTSVLCQIIREKSLPPFNTRTSLSPHNLFSQKYLAQLCLQIISRGMCKLLKSFVDIRHNQPTASLI